MSRDSDSPQTSRARSLYHDGPRIDENLKPVPTRITPSSFSDGQDRMGTPRSNEHRDAPLHYAHPKARAYREDLRARPSAKPHRIFKSK
jgi:hypothetical protein